MANLGFLALSVNMKFPYAEIAHKILKRGRIPSAISACGNFKFTHNIAKTLLSKFRLKVAPDYSFY